MVSQYTAYRILLKNYSTHLKYTAQNGQFATAIIGRIFDGQPLPSFEFTAELESNNAKAKSIGYSPGDNPGDGLGGAISDGSRNSELAGIEFISGVGAGKDSWFAIKLSIARNFR